LGETGADRGLLVDLVGKAEARGDVIPVAIELTLGTAADIDEAQRTDQIGVTGYRRERRLG